jgi:hypothetical protein
VTLYKAVTPDGHSYYKTERDKVLRFAMWVKYPHRAQCVLDSWYATEEGARRNSPKNASKTRGIKWGVIPVEAVADNGQV